jgi:hypothetical protein
MRFIVAIAGLALATGVSAGASAQEASSADQQAELTEARAIMELMFPPAEREQTFGVLIGQAVEQFRASVPVDSVTDPQLRAILERHFDSIPERLGPTISRHLPKIIEATASAYTHEFTLAELKDIHAFAQSPSGEHYLNRSAALVGDPDVATVNTAFFAEVQEIQAAFQNDLITELSAYIAEHPEAAAALAGSPDSSTESP